MDPRYHPAVAAIKAGDLEQFQTLISEDPSLATATLLQCVVLDGYDVPHSVEMARILIDGGANPDGPLIAASSMDNVEVIPVLLDAGAAINGNGVWSPLEDALAFGADRAIRILLERGATIHNLRLAAGLGRADLIDGFFNSDGSLNPQAGKLAWPFGDPDEGWSQDPQDLIDNAFVYACMGGHLEAAERLLRHGARINAVPPGFDYAGSGLHYAARAGHQRVVEFLLAHGGDSHLNESPPQPGNFKTVTATPAEWAGYNDHPEIKEFLEKVGSAEQNTAGL